MVLKATHGYEGKKNITVEFLYTKLRLCEPTCRYNHKGFVLVLQEGWASSFEVEVVN